MGAPGGGHRAGAAPEAQLLRRRAGRMPAGPAARAAAPSYCLHPAQLDSPRPPCFRPQVLSCDIDLLHPPAELEKQRHKLHRLVEAPNSYFMDVKCQGCFTM